MLELDLEPKGPIVVLPPLIRRRESQFAPLATGMDDFRRREFRNCGAHDAPVPALLGLPGAEVLALAFGLLVHGLLLGRGPRPPARPCSYNIKMFHAQNAGAVGVVVVDYDPDGRFSVVPRAELGPLYPNGPDLRKLSIPGFLTLYSMAGALQDGAVTTMMMAPPTPKGLEQGWRLGVIYCRKQENQRSGLSRAKADLLMSEFFEQRRHERAEEQVGCSLEPTSLLCCADQQIH